MIPVRRVVGLEAARKVLLSNRSIEPEDLPPALLARTQAVVGEVKSAAEAVARILEAVRHRGDAAIREFTQAFDGAEIGALEVPASEIDAAMHEVPVATRKALEAAAERIRQFHERALRRTW